MTTFAEVDLCCRKECVTHGKHQHHALRLPRNRGLLFPALFLQPDCGSLSASETPLIQREQFGLTRFFRKN